jgi:Porin subfamily
MTLMKSILLGSAAGIVAVATAQAADLPTRKAAPAEYVKVCNVGGMAGWVLPGSDTCFKISGYITGQVEGGNLKQAYSYSYGTMLGGKPATGATGAGLIANGQTAVIRGLNNSERSSFGYTTRANLDFDVRQDTAFGVLRGYAELQFENGNGFDSTGVGAYINRAYVQWAGLTAGKANSFFSFFGGGEGWANIFSPDQQGYNQPDLLAYTATFGGGFSATVSAQSSGANQPSFASSAYTNSGNGAATSTWGSSGSGTNMGGNYNSLGMEAPDIVLALRVDQGWGSAQVSGVAHQVRVEDVAGYTDNTWGWGVLGGVKFNLPQFGAGDNVAIQGVWTRNAVWYSGIPDGMWGENGAVNGNGLPMYVGDTYSNGNGSWATPTAWSIGGTYEHHFSPVFSVDPEFSYAELHWSGLGIGSGIPVNANSWIVGAVAHWDPVPHLDFAFELLYQATHQSTPTGLPVAAPTVAQPANFPKDTDGFAGRFYVTRDF